MAGVHAPVGQNYQAGRRGGKNSRMGRRGSDGIAEVRRACGAFGIRRPRPLASPCAAMARILVARNSSRSFSAGHHPAGRRLWRPVQGMHPRRWDEVVQRVSTVACGGGTSRDESALARGNSRVVERSVVHTAGPWIRRPATGRFMYQSSEEVDAQELTHDAECRRPHNFC